MEENTLSSNLERIKTAMDNIRETTNMPDAIIEQVAATVNDLKLKGPIKILDNTALLNDIENPQIGDICIVNRGPEEIAWSNTNINTNVFIFPDNVILPEFGDDRYQVGIFATCVIPEEYYDAGTISYDKTGLRIEIQYDNVYLDVVYDSDLSVPYHYYLDSIVYEINGVSQTVENGVVPLPFCFIIKELEDGDPVNFDYIKQFIHTYKAIPYNWYMSSAKYGIIIKPGEFTLSRPVTAADASTGYVSSDDYAVQGSWQFDNTKFGLSTTQGSTDFMSNDGQYYSTADASHHLSTNLLWGQEGVWLDGDESARSLTGLLEEICSYIPNFVLIVCRYDEDGWQEIDIVPQYPSWD